MDIPIETRQRLIEDLREKSDALKKEITDTYGDFGDIIQYKETKVNELAAATELIKRLQKVIDECKCKSEPYLLVPKKELKPRLFKPTASSGASSFRGEATPGFRSMREVFRPSSTHALR